MNSASTMDPLAPSNSNSKVAQNQGPDNEGIQASAPSTKALAFREASTFEKIQVEEAPKASGPFHGDLLLDLQKTNPRTAQRLTEAINQLPEAGTIFCGFELIKELGRGAFGRVFLARQLELSERLVAIKISVDALGESQTLAQLLHTNVVPIYSIHRDGALQATCMPYCGSVTLHQVITTFQTTKSIPHTGKEFVTTMFGGREHLATGSRSVRSVPLFRASGSLTRIHEPSQENLGDSGTREISQEEASISRGASVLILKMMEGLSYVDAVLWIGSRLADGLAHAHERGILHRDLKPANILITDEGQPMLLDFNLAEDTKVPLGTLARIGGTLPYMAPEVIRGVLNQKTVLDPRGDIYSLGIILFEMLTGTHPFRIHQKDNKNYLAEYLRDREGEPPRLIPLNHAVTPASESIVRRCLAPNRIDRYQSARELQEDLERQIKNQPLKHAQDPSPHERLKKWARRHPRLSSSTSIGLVALILIGVVIGILAARNHRLQWLEAQADLNRFRQEAMAVKLSLTSQTSDQASFQQAMNSGHEAVNRYEALTNPHWTTERRFRLLSPEHQSWLREELGSLLLVMTRAALLQAQITDSSQNQDGLETALTWNQLAETCFPANNTPNVLWHQRTDLLKLLGRSATTSNLDSNLNSTNQSSRDSYLSAWEHACKGEYLQALPLLKGAVQKDPENLWAWFLLAHCWKELGNPTQTVSCYNTCIALWPNSSRLYFNRGLARLQLYEHALALDDFNTVIALDPEQPDAYFNRGVTHQALSKHAEAVEDYTLALKHGASPTRVYFARARAYEQIKNFEAAQKDREQGLRIRPTDEHGWVVRGLALVTTEPKKALEDYNQALKINPRFRPALDNKTYVLSEVLKQPEAAIDSLTKTLELYPDYAKARTTRGVYYARLGRRDLARNDAEEALIIDGSPSIAYQAAGIYALNSRENPNDRREAFLLLASALRKGYGFDLLEIDRDLDPIRDLPEFRRIVEVGKALQQRNTPTK